MKRETLNDKIIERTEIIGASLADLADVIEAQHYNPSAYDEKDYQILLEVEKLICKALKAGSKRA